MTHLWPDKCRSTGYHQYRQDGCAVSMVMCPPSLSQYPRNISLSAFCLGVLLWVLLKPPARSQYSGIFCRQRMLPQTCISERGSEAFMLTCVCAVVCGHSLEGVPARHCIQSAWFPQDGGTILPQGRALPGRNEPPLLPSPSSLSSTFCFHFLWVGITQLTLDPPVILPF